MKSIKSNAAALTAAGLAAAMAGALTGALTGAGLAQPPGATGAPFTLVGEADGPQWLVVCTVETSDGMFSEHRMQGQAPYMSVRMTVEDAVFANCQAGTPERTRLTVSLVDPDGAWRCPFSGPNCSAEYVGPSESLFELEQ